jgi:tRNA threonylcarbamoyl adenosine modification protein YeaZ
MILYINTTSGEKVYLALGKAGKLIIKKEFKAKYKQSELLLPAIDLLLKKAKVKPKSLDSIVVVKGPGPFTATRIGVTVANALGYAMGIPIIGFKISDFRFMISDHRFQDELIKKGYEKLRKIKKKKGVMAVEPVYDKRPNITIKN